jgi:hypothetical protein
VSNFLDDLLSVRRIFESLHWKVQSAPISRKDVEDT